MRVLASVVCVGVSAGLGAVCVGVKNMPTKIPAGTESGSSKKN